MIKLVADEWLPVLNDSSREELRSRIGSLSTADATQIAYLAMVTLHDDVVECLSSHVDLEAAVDESGLTLLGAATQGRYEDAAVALLAPHGMYLEGLSFCACRFDWIAKVPPCDLYFVGRRNVLHVAVDAGSLSMINFWRRTLPNGIWHRLLLETDNDGNTARRLACILGRSELLKALQTDSQDGTQTDEQWDAPKRSLALQAMRQRAHSSVLSGAKKQEQCTADSVLFQLDIPFSTSFSSDRFIREHWRETVEPIMSGVFAVNLFSDEGLNLFQVQLQSILDQAASNPRLQLQRPNSMNRYGFVLQRCGFGAWLSGFVSDLLTVLDSEYHITTTCSASEVVEEVGFHSVHAFYIRYTLGEDKDLATHRDDSDFTFNICLGDEGHTGSELYFIDDDGQEVVQYRHRPGWAVFHRGAVLHGVHPLRGGVRRNVVIWCKRASGHYM